MGDRCCGNCKFMAPVYMRADQKIGFLEAFGLRPMEAPEGKIVNGKGACMEPSVSYGRVAPYHVTDMALCSMWEGRPE